MKARKPCYACGAECPVDSSYPADAPAYCASCALEDMPQQFYELEQDDMADYCVDCADYKGQHDLPETPGWYRCEGCGYHLFVMGYRICRRGPIPIADIALGPCPDCATL